MKSVPRFTSFKLVTPDIYARGALSIPISGQRNHTAFTQRFSVLNLLKVRILCLFALSHPDEQVR